MKREAVWAEIERRLELDLEDFGVTIHSVACGLGLTWEEVNSAASERYAVSWLTGKIKREAL